MRLMVLTFSFLIAVSILVVSSLSRREIDRDFKEARAAEAMLRARLDRETGLRGYLNTGLREFLRPYEQGVRDYEVASREAHKNAAGDRRTIRSLDAQDELARTWDVKAAEAIALADREGAHRGTHTGASLAAARERYALMQRFRAANADLVRHIDKHRQSREHLITWVIIAMVVILSLAGLALAHFLVDVPARRRNNRSARQAELSDSLQLADGEREAYELLARHLARTVGESGRAVVLNRNNSADRLEAATPLTENSPLAPRLVGATPRSCLAVRKGRTHEQSAAGDALMKCELCGIEGFYTMCVPSLIAGEVIGSSLVAKESPVADEEREAVEASVRQAAPVLANLRNLRLAEMRAATDAMTGLANNRATQDNLKRLVAMSQRNGKPLAVILLDLDRFKSINDTFGHSVGDDVLEAVGSVLQSNVRSSDFVGRYGGEEFVIVAPETDQEGAQNLAEKVRSAMSMLHVPTYTGRITASFGIAMHPEHGADSDLLLAAADEALYRAKREGRNGVRLATSKPLLEASNGATGEGVQEEGATEEARS